jgi:hypothetical protein
MTRKNNAQNNPADFVPDSRVPTTDPDDIKGAKNYVAAALADIAGNRPVDSPSTRPYGCSVKYRL